MLTFIAVAQSIDWNDEDSFRENFLSDPFTAIIQNPELAFKLIQEDNLLLDNQNVLRALIGLLYSAPIDTCEFPICGDSILCPTEQCDDGNLKDGDGCSSKCEVEVRFKSSCGDGFVGITEQCEAPNTVNNPFCRQLDFKCERSKTLTRSPYGSCLNDCSCAYTEYKAQCIKDVCGASCGNDADCGENNACDLSTCSCKTSTDAVCGNGIKEGNEECDFKEEQIVDDNGFCIYKNTCVGCKLKKVLDKTKSTFEICDGIDNDCNGKIDDYIIDTNVNENAYCEKQLGICSGATRTCNGKQGFGECTAKGYNATGLYALDVVEKIFDIKRANPSEYAVTFDGTNDYLKRGADLTGNADGKKGILSFWFRINGGDGTTMTPLQGYFDEVNQFQRFHLDREVNNKFTLYGRAQPDATILFLQTNSAFKAGSGWHHYLASWDAGNLTSYMYINDVDDKRAESTIVDGTIKYALDNYVVGSQTSGSAKFNGDLAFFYVNLAEYLNISIESNRRKFITEDGLPADLGADGSLPTGTAPIVFLSGNSNQFIINKGYGGDFNKNGELADSTLKFILQTMEALCDNIDNDCDGLTDEGCECKPGSIRKCGFNDIGICNRGTQTCSQDGRWGECFDAILPESNSETRCDAIDNDCDGLIDEGLTNRCGECGQLPKEICNFRDDDCNAEEMSPTAALFDSFTNSFFAFHNYCPPGKVCKGSYADGIDNDGDGIIDENIDEKVKASPRGEYTNWCYVKATIEIAVEGDLKESKIINLGATDIEGFLIMKIQKNINNQWIDAKIVIDDKEKRAIKPKEILDLGKIWEEKGAYTAETAGTFRVYAALTNEQGFPVKTVDNKILEDSFEFVVVG